jgi:hypothetical protein
MFSSSCTLYGLMCAGLSVRAFPGGMKTQLRQPGDEHPLRMIHVLQAVKPDLPPSALQGQRILHGKKLDRAPGPGECIRS